MKIHRGIAARYTAGIVGGLMLVGAGSAAMAAYPDPDDTDGVDVTVDIAEVDGGALSLTVDGTEAVLAESGSTATERVFTGALPEVTVTDTRDDVAPGAYWYVVGQAGDFTSADGQPSIPASQLGWMPAEVTDGSGEVAAGSEVVPASDDETQPGNNTGLVSGEDLLYMSLDSAQSQAVQGSWSTTADLTLKTEPTVAPGSYTSVLTLSLFEDSM